MSEKIKAYRPGSWGELPLPVGIHIAVVLNDYHIRNLRWLLRHAWHGRAPEHLNTGDWCGEILWALEAAMIEAGLTGRDAWANGPDGGWPLDGYHVEFASKLRATLSAESPSTPESVSLTERPRHAFGAIRKAAGWAFAEGMTLQQFLVVAQAAFANAEKERPHV